jgi:hypothetical protein
VEPNTAGDNNQEVSPFLPIETASQITKGQREQRFWKYWLANNPTTESKMAGLQDALAAYDAHEADVRKFIRDAEEQSLADWTATAESYRDEFLMPLRNRKGDSEANFVNFYRTELIEYSPAEGGCFYLRRLCLASFPVSYFNAVNYYGEFTTPEGAEQKTLEAAKEYGRDKFGLTFQGDRVEGCEGDREVRGFSSSRPEADGEAMLERFPFQSATMTVPHYE